MYRFIRRGTVRLSGSFYALLALALMTVPLPWIFAWICAALVHELGHIAAVCLLGHQIQSISLEWGGTRIVTDALGDVEWICAAAGPVCGSLALLLAKRFPVFALSAFVQTIFNLLPVYPLDGGRILLSFLRMICKESIACKISKWVSAVILLLGMVAVLPIAVKYSLGIGPFFLIAFLAFKSEVIKFPCKDDG